MKALVLQGVRDLSTDQAPLAMVERERPVPTDNQLLVRVEACGVCHTELDEIEGRTPPPSFPVVPGHQVVGIVEAMGAGVTLHRVGDRVGVGWIHSSCGTCRYCEAGNDNLCPSFRATGRDVDGGYAEYMTVPESSAFPIPARFSPMEAAPLLCAGAIGYRSLNLGRLQNGQRLGLSGFGASAHLVLQMARHQFPASPVYVFARSRAEQAFARKLGARWAGDTEMPAPDPLDVIIDTTPAWSPIVEALGNLAPEGRLVINAIRKEHTDQDALLRLDYPRHLWMEKEIKSVANVSRRDIAEFLKLADDMCIRPEVQVYRLDEANRALVDLKQRRIRGAKVLRIGQES